MLENIFTDFLLEQLAGHLDGYSPPTSSQAYLPDQWIALSLMQKAIRRGDTPQAIRAASYLNNLDYRMLWRRLVVIAWEDIGVGDPDLCFMVTAAAGSRKWRQQHGGDWSVAAYLTTAMSKSIKDRSTDDLMMVALHDPSLEDERHDYDDLQFGGLLEIIHDETRPMPKRIIAAWYACGTEHYGFEGLRRRKGDVVRYFHALSADLCPEHVTSLCRIGVSRSRTVLPAFIPTFWRHYAQGEYLTFVADGEILEHLLSGIPRYAFDGFTRAGKRYLKKIAREHTELKAFLAQSASPPERNALVEEMYFRIESSPCDKRLDWPVGLKAQKRADEIGYGLDAPQFNAGKAILRDALKDMPMTEADL